MALLPFAIGLLVSAQPAPPAPPAHGAPRPPDSWWECYHFLPPAGGPAAVSGRMFRYFTLAGQGNGGSYEQWGAGLRVTWRLVETPLGLRSFVASLSVEIPAALSRNGGAIHGDLFGDGALIATTTMLDEHGARRGHAASTAFFHGLRGREIAAPLAAADRWTLVVRHADGTEIVRRDLPIPGRRAREEGFARHWAALEAAWTARDPILLVTTPADTLPSDRASCLLSTPAARDEMEGATISIQ